MRCLKVPQPSPELVGMPTFLVVDFLKIKKSMIWIILKKWVKKMQILALFCLVQLECTLQSTFFFH
jgi:hypothetical protein